MVAVSIGGGGGGNRGGNNNNNAINNFLRDAPDRAYCTSANSTTAERLAPISEILTKGKKPLTPDQEKKFSGLIETKLPQMQEELKAANPQMQQLLNSLNQNRNNNNNNNATLNPQTLRNNIVNTIMTQLGIPNNNNNNNNRGNRGNNNQNPNNANANNAAANNNNPTAQQCQRGGEQRGQCEQQPWSW